MWSSPLFKQKNIVYSFISFSLSFPLIPLPPSVSLSLLLSVGHPWSVQAAWRHAPLSSQHLVSSRQLHTYTHTQTHTHTHTHTHTNINIDTFNFGTLKTCWKVSLISNNTVYSRKSYHLNTQMTFFELEKNSIGLTFPIQTIIHTASCSTDGYLNLYWKTEQVVWEVRAETSHWPPPH